MPDITFPTFRHDFAVMGRRTKLRQGQLLFNMLWALRPDLADAIRTGPMDPFYRDDLIPDCMLFLEARWDRA